MLQSEGVCVISLTVIFIGSSSRADVVVSALFPANSLTFYGRLFRPTREKMGAVAMAELNKVLTQKTGHGINAHWLYSRI